jgi:hypothetical protein
MTLRPVVSSTRLAENEVVGSEKLTERTSADGIHGTGLQIDEDGTRDVLVAGSLFASAYSFLGINCLQHTSLK